MLRVPAIRIAAIASAILLVAIGWYLGSPLFIRTTVDEAPPGDAVSATVPPPNATRVPVIAEPSCGATPDPTTRTRVLRRGELQYVDALHNGKGAVLHLIVSGGCPVGDQQYVRFESVAITNAPDVHVYLSRDTGGRWSEPTSLYLGPLRATNGSFNYDIPPGTDVAGYGSVVVWCRAFAVLVTWADLARV